MFARLFNKQMPDEEVEDQLSYLNDDPTSHVYIPQDSDNEAKHILYKTCVIVVLVGTLIVTITYIIIAAILSAQRGSF